MSIEIETSALLAGILGNAFPAMMKQGRLTLGGRWNTQTAEGDEAI